MMPAAFYSTIQKPAASFFRSPYMTDTAESRLLLLAIAGQESQWTFRVQDNDGPARGFWQTEEPDVISVLSLFPTQMEFVCDAMSIPTDPDTVYEAIAYNDALAYAVARCILLADPKPLPAVGNQDAAWDCYQRNWRPGAPSTVRWAVAYPQAVDVLK